jgi:hypothetical protein
MKTSPLPSHSSRRLLIDHQEQSVSALPKPPSLFRREVRIICLYPTVEAGKLARQWVETALGHASPQTFPRIEYFNYTVLNLDAISWNHALGDHEPDIILMVSDGKHTLAGGLRNSLRELFSHSGNGRKPLVVFRDLEPEPTLNTRVLLDYVSALSQRNHCELNAINGNGTPISCFRHPRLLLTARRRLE